MIRNFLKIFISALFLGAPLAGWTQDQDTVLARVGNHKITLGHVALFYEQLSNEYQTIPIADIYPAIVDQLIREAMLAQISLNGGDLKIQKRAENFLNNQLASALIETAVAQNEPRLRALYEARIANMPDVEEWNASHILVKTRAEAEALISALEGGAAFTTLAREKSIGPSGDNGGLLGWFGKGAMVPAFEKAVTALEEAQISAPVQTQFGWHVVKLNAKRMQPKATYEQALPNLQRILSEELITEIVAERGESIRIKRSDVEIDPEILRDPKLFRSKK